MCYILLAINQSGEYPFILAANRDEFYQRESSPLTTWNDKPQIAGGRDLEQGGTWMAVTKTGRFAAITNYREAGKTNRPQRSRGLLVTDFLDSDIKTEHFSVELAGQADLYSGFNLIYGTLTDKLFYFSNRDNKKAALLTPGVYALSNHLLDTPWPKVVSGKLAFEKIITDQAGNIESSLFKLLGDQTTAAIDELPHTGIDNHFELVLSSIYIESKNYGTRCSSVITVDPLQQLNFTELTHDCRAEPVSNPATVSFNLQDEVDLPE